MDYRLRDYYLVWTDRFSWDMRHEYYKTAAPSIKRHSRKYTINSPCFTADEMISCLKDESESLEYELRKAARNDKWSSFIKVNKTLMEQ